MEFDLGDTTGGQGVTNCHQTHSLITGFIQRHVHHVLPHLQVTAAMDDLRSHKQQVTNAVTKWIQIDRNIWKGLYLRQTQDHCFQTKADLDMRYVSLVLSALLLPVQLLPYHPTTITIMIMEVFIWTFVVQIKCYSKCSFAVLAGIITAPFMQPLPYWLVIKRLFQTSQQYLRTAVSVFVGLYLSCSTVRHTCVLAMIMRASIHWTKIWQ